MNQITVATGVIVDPTTRRLLYQLRPEGKMRGGCWEHPGGKVEPGETMSAALARELREELGDGLEFSPIGNAPIACGTLDLVTHAVTLTMFGLMLVNGTPRPLAATALRWSHPQAPVDLWPCTPLTWQLHRPLMLWLAAMDLHPDPGWVDL